MKYIGNSKLKKKFNINASSEEVYNNYTNSDSVSVSKKKMDNSLERIKTEQDTRKGLSSSDESQEKFYMLT